MGKLKNNLEKVKEKLCMLTELEKPWIGVDFDGTLFTHPEGNEPYGKPIPLMIRRVRSWLKKGKRVKIMTARWAIKEQRVIQEQFIRQALLKHIGNQAANLEITNEKDYMMTELWDDRAVQVIMDTGERADGIKDF
jgi:hypothetical protein